MSDRHHDRSIIIVGRMAYMVQPRTIVMHDITNRPSIYLPAPHIVHGRLCGLPRKRIASEAVRKYAFLIPLPHEMVNTRPAASAPAQWGGSGALHACGKEHQGYRSFESHRGKDLNEEICQCSYQRSREKWI